MSSEEGYWNYQDTREYLRRSARTEWPPVIITVAITGGLQEKEVNPNLPESPDEQAEQTYAAYQAGASIVHIHARDKTIGYADTSGRAGGLQAPQCPHTGQMR